MAVRCPACGWWNDNHLRCGRCGPAAADFKQQAAISICMREAIVAIANRRGAWIDRAVKTIQAHNRNIEMERVCGLCAGNAPLLWEPPT